jgi:hypothetical protein
MRRLCAAVAFMALLMLAACGATLPPTDDRPPLSSSYRRKLLQKKISLNQYGEWEIIELSATEGGATPEAPSSSGAAAATAAVRAGALLHNVIMCWSPHHLMTASM